MVKKIYAAVKATAEHSLTLRLPDALAERIRALQGKAREHGDLVPEIRDYLIQGITREGMMQAQPRTGNAIAFEYKAVDLHLPADLSQLVTEVCEEIKRERGGTQKTYPKGGIICASVAVYLSEVEAHYNKIEKQKSKKRSKK